MSSIAEFYDSSAFRAEREALATERNPDIQGESIRGLGKDSSVDARALLVPLLQSQSYRNHVLEAAITALAAQNDPADIAGCETRSIRENPK